MTDREVLTRLLIDATVPFTSEEVTAIVDDLVLVQQEWNRGSPDWAFRMWLERVGGVRNIRSYCDCLMAGRRNARVPR